MKTQRLSTGNEVLSIPEITTSTAGIECIGFVHSGLRACIELHGGDGLPLLRPVVEIDGVDLFSGPVESDLLSYWVPSFSAANPKARAEALTFAPMERRGFVCTLTIENTSPQEIRFNAGWRGCWESSFQIVSMSRPITGTAHACISSWQEGVAVIEFRGNTPLFAMAMAPGEVMSVRLRDADDQAEVDHSTGSGFSRPAGSPVCYELLTECTLAAGERKTLQVYVGVGPEEVSAAASAHEMRVQGSDRLLASLRSWLDAHTIDCEDDYFKALMNVNSFYNFFYSQAVTLDTEDLVVTTARSSSNESCGVYRGRDAMLWALPAVMRINAAQARRMLIYAFTTQLANVGVRSRFIDGTVLEPGLQLDQLCSSVRGLYTYVQRTGDVSLLFDRRIQAGINAVTEVLAVQRHPDVALFETLLLPSGDPSLYPYVCYSNALVWRILVDLSSLYDNIRDADRADEVEALAGKVRAAVLDEFVVDGPFGKMFARSIDLEGNHELGDDPAGSLQLLTYLGVCSPTDPVYVNTVMWIHSEHNPHAGYGYPFEGPSVCAGAGPSVLAAVNDLLTGRKQEALDFLTRAALDNGIACETVDCTTGCALTGKAFASGAGYLAFGLWSALNATAPQAASEGLPQRAAEALYQPPPEVRRDSRKARL